MTFSKLLAGQRLTPQRAFRMPLPLISLDWGSPALFLIHCGEENPAFYNAWKKRQIMRSGPPATVERLQRAVDAPILGELGVVGWEHICEDGPDATAVPVDFAPAKAVEFLIALSEDAPQIFDNVRGFCMMDDLYRDAPAPDPGAVGKG